MHFGCIKRGRGGRQDHDDMPPKCITERMSSGRAGSCITWRGDRTNLHQLWDSRVVEALGHDSARVAQDVRRSISLQQRKSWQAGSAAAWASESHRIARDRVYPGMQGRRSVRLPPTYIRDAMPVTRQQLAKAGVRLAWLLNTSLK